MHASLAAVTATSPLDHFNPPRDIGREELDVNFYPPAKDQIETEFPTSLGITKRRSSNADFKAIRRTSEESAFLAAKGRDRREI